MEKLLLRDFLRYKFISGIEFSPAGERAAFVVAESDEEENIYRRRLWLYDFSDGLMQLTDIGDEGSFVWEDENTILFPAKRSTKEKKRAMDKEEFTSYYRLKLDSCGEACSAFIIPFAAGHLKHIEGSLWLASGKIDKNMPDYYKMDAQERAEFAKTKEDEKDYEVFDEVPFWSNGQGIINGRRNALFIYDAKDGSCERITEPDFETDSFEIISGRIYYTGSARGAHSIRNYSELFVYDIKTKTNRKVCTYEELYIHGLLAAEDELFVIASEGKRYGLNENAWIYKVDKSSGKLDVWHEEDYSMYSSVGSDCRLGGGKQITFCENELYHLTTRGGNSYLYAVGKDGRQKPVIEKDGSIDCFDVSAKHEKVLMVAMYDNKLQELYIADANGENVTQLSHFNEEPLKDKYVAEPQYLSVRSEGLNIEGWVLLPRDYDETKTYPAVLDIHGGPKTVYGPVFYHEMQVWANLGYFVFYCNPKGSDGRDNEFMDIRGQYGDTDYKNIMDFTDAVLRKYPQIEKNRICVTGGSYGGFMTNWIIGHTDRFVCAASQRSIANWISFYGISDIGIEFGADQCAAEPFSSPDKMWMQSPMSYAANVKTPTLFIHSDEDYRCPLAEGLQMYTSLVANGVEARLCLFHGENHELSRSGKPKHRVRRLTEITNWFEAHARA